MKKKLNFEKKMDFYRTLVVLGHHHMKRKPYQTIISTSNNGLKIEKKDEQYKYKKAI